MTIGSEPLKPILGEPLDTDLILGPPLEIGSILDGPTTSVAILTPEPPQQEQAETPPPEPPAAPSPPRYSPVMARRLHDASRLVLTIAVFGVPIVFDPRTVDAFNLTKLTVLWVLTTIAGGLWLVGAVLRPPDGWPMRLGLSLQRPSVVGLALVLLAVTSVATALSSSRALSFFGLYHRFEGLLSLILYVVVVALTVALYRRQPARLRQVVVAFGAAAVVVAFYVALQKLGVDVASWQEVGGTAPRFPIGSLGNAGLTGSLLGISIPFVIYLARTARSAERRAAWASGGVLVAVGLWLTQSRPGVLAAAFGALALFVFTRVRMSPWRTAGVVGAALLVLMLAPLVAPGIVGPRAPSELTVVRTGADAARYRVHMWDAAWRMTLERPLFGWGPDTFYGNHARFRSQTEARQQELAITDKPQNILLGWATSTGFGGLLAYLALAGSAIMLAAGGLRKLARRHRGLAACFGAGFVAYLVQGMYSIDVPPLALVGWLCIGGVAALQHALEREAEADETTEPSDGAVSRRRVPAGWPFYTVVGFTVLALIALGSSALRADHAAWAAERRAPAGGSQATMRLYEKAVSLSPFEAAYKGLAAFYLERVAGEDQFPTEGTLLRAASLYGKANGLQPGNVYFMINASRVYERLAATVDAKYYASADAWLERAVSIDELDPQIHDLYASLLRRWAPKAGADHDDIERRAQVQAAIAQQLRTGRVVR